MAPLASPPDPLDRILSQWTVAGEPPGTLPHDVWVRISAGQGEPSWWETLAAAVLRPRAIGFTGLAAVAAGCVLALLRPAEPPLDPHTAYVQSVSPFASVHLASH